jgi:rfaE bifunctional protein kinase chain/domain
MRKGSVRWQRLIRSFRGKTIGIYGDFMLDEVLRGQATRISPEAPVPVVLIKSPDSVEGYPGGAGNVATNIAALGGHPIPWGVIGKDLSGKRLLKLLAERGIPCDTLIQEPHRLTPRKLRVAAHQHQLIRLDFERIAPISPHSASHLIRSFAKWARRLDALIVSDYQKGSVIQDVFLSFVRKARQGRVPIFVDPKPGQAEFCRNVTAVTPNLHEAELMAGISIRSEPDIARAGKRLIEQFGCEYLLITRSSEGMTLFAADGAMHSIASIPRPVYDVTGAGDTVIAVLALAYCSGATMIEAARLANLAAGKVVLKFGTSQIGWEELIDATPEDKNLI